MLSALHDPLSKGMPAVFGVLRMSAFPSDHIKPGVFVGAPFSDLCCRFRVRHVDEVYATLIQVDSDGKEDRDQQYLVLIGDLMPD